MHTALVRHGTLSLITEPAFFYIQSGPLFQHYNNLAPDFLPSCFPLLVSLFCSPVSCSYGSLPASRTSFALLCTPSLSLVSLPFLFFSVPPLDARFLRPITIPFLYTKFHLDIFICQYIINISRMYPCLKLIYTLICNYGTIDSNFDGPKNKIKICKHVVDNFNNFLNNLN